MSSPQRNFTKDGDVREILFIDPQVRRRIVECDVKIENCEFRISNVKESGEDLKALKGRLKDLQGVRKGLVEEGGGTADHG